MGVEVLIRTWLFKNGLLSVQDCSHVSQELELCSKVPETGRQA